VDKPRAGILSGFLSEKELAQELGHCERTLARWRKLRVGPPFVMNGREPIYDSQQVRAWLAAGGTSKAAPRQRRRLG
jgi:hypothetical protein